MVCDILYQFRRHCFVEFVLLLYFTQSKVAMMWDMSAHLQQVPSLQWPMPTVNLIIRTVIYILLHIKVLPFSAIHFHIFHTQYIGDTHHVPPHLPQVILGFLLSCCSFYNYFHFKPLTIDVFYFISSTKTGCCSITARHFGIATTASRHLHLALTHLALHHIRNTTYPSSSTHLQFINTPALF